jgi:electron transport complex protein RnfG
MKEILKLAFALMIFATVACVALAFVYASTEGRIAENQSAKLNAALMDIFGEGAVFEKVDGFSGLDGDAVKFGTAYAAKKSGALAGIALNASDQGFNDTITALVGVDAGGKIAGVRILQNTDTPGLGANAGSAAYFVDKPANTKTFYDQFAGMEAGGNIKVTKDGGKVEAITAATITSRAVSRVVNSAGIAGRNWLAGNGAVLKKEAE